MRRSAQIWVVIALTLAPAVYFTGVLVRAVSLYTRSDATGVSPMYVIFTLTILMLVGVAFAVYRGHRWTLHFYLIIALGQCINLVTTAPTLWAKFIPVLRNRPHPWGEFEQDMIFNMIAPIAALAGAVYCTAVIFLKIWRVHPASGVSK